MKLINGTKIARKITSGLKKEIGKLKSKPHLAVILVGNDAASKLYVSLKEKKAAEIGVAFSKHLFSPSVDAGEVVNLIKELNEDEKVSGIIVQLPLPPFFDPDKIINTIAPEKDVDGFCEKNRKNLLAGKELTLKPVLPQAFLEILRSVKIKLAGKKVAAVVNSEIFGKTLAAVFEQENARCDYLVKKVCLDKGLEDFLREADVVISATGCPGLIKGGMIKQGATLLDAGVSREGKKTRGDVDAQSVEKKAAYLTPTPLGVGPVTVAMLLANVFLAFKNKNGGN